MSRVVRGYRSSITVYNLDMCNCEVFFHPISSLSFSPCGIVFVVVKVLFVAKEFQMYKEMWGFRDYRKSGMLMY